MGAFVRVFVCTPQTTQGGCSVTWARWRSGSCSCVTHGYVHAAAACVRVSPHALLPLRLLAGFRAWLHASMSACLPVGVRAGLISMAVFLYAVEELHFVEQIGRPAFHWVTLALGLVLAGLDLSAGLMRACVLAR